MASLNKAAERQLHGSTRRHRREAPQPAPGQGPQEVRRLDQVADRVAARLCRRRAALGRRPGRPGSRRSGRPGRQARRLGAGPRRGSRRALGGLPGRVHRRGAPSATRATTVLKLRQTARDLTEFLPAGIGLRAVTPVLAERFKTHLLERKLAAATISRRVKQAGMFFTAARKRKLVPDNPFAEVRHKCTNPEANQHYVSVADIEPSSSRRPTPSGKSSSPWRGTGDFAARRRCCRSSGSTSTSRRAG